MGKYFGREFEKTCKVPEFNFDEFAGRELNTSNTSLLGVASVASWTIVCKSQFVPRYLAYFSSSHRRYGSAKWTIWALEGENSLKKGMYLRMKRSLMTFGELPITVRTFRSEPPLNKRTDKGQILNSLSSGYNFPAKMSRVKALFNYFLHPSRWCNFGFVFSDRFWQSSKSEQIMD